jgi:thioredoxin reductase (NADPH)
MDQAHRPRPVLLAVDDDADDRAKIERELYDRYGRSYRIVCEASAEAGMSTLEKLRAAGEEVAVVLADLWMPKMTGPEFLAHAHRIFPTAKRALLVTWGDPSVREPIVRSMTLGQIDYYVPKPGRSPDERFHAIIAQFLSEWSKAGRGHQHIAGTGQDRAEAIGQTPDELAGETECAYPRKQNKPREQRTAA